MWEYRARARLSGGSAWTSSPEVVSISWGKQPNLVRPNQSCGFWEKLLQRRFGYEVIDTQSVGQYTVQILKQVESPSYQYNGFGTCVYARFVSETGGVDIQGNLYVGELGLGDNKKARDTIEQGLAEGSATPLTLESLGNLYQLQRESAPRLTASCMGCTSVKTEEEYVRYRYLKRPLIESSGSFTSMAGAPVKVSTEWETPTSALPPIFCGMSQLKIYSTTVKGIAFEFVAWLVEEIAGAWLCSNDYRRALSTEIRYDLPGLREDIADKIIKDRFISF